MTVTILTAASHQGDSLAALLVPAVRRPGVAIYARNDAAAYALVTAAADAGGRRGRPARQSRQGEHGGHCEQNDRADLAQRVLGPTTAIARS